MKTILLTGLTGYLGSNIARELVAEGYKVVGLIRKSSRLQRISDICDELSLYPVEDRGIEKVFSDYKIDMVIHAATSYGRNEESNSQLLESNLIFPLKVYEESLKSSNCVFINTSTSLAESVNPYALSKYQFKEWGKLISASNKGKFVDLVLEHFYGPDDGEKKFTSYLITSCLNNIPNIPLTKGEQKRDFIFIRDVVSAYMLLIRNIEKIPVGYSEYEIGSGEALTIKELSQLVLELTESESKLSFGEIPYRENEPMFLQANISALTKLGWRPEYSLRQGLTKTISKEKTK